MKHNRIMQALGLASVVFVAGCSDDGETSTPVVTAPQASYSVTAIDGYLRNAEVWLDLNGNFARDDGEPSAITGEGGRAELDVTDIDTPEQYSVVVRAIAGETVDEDTPDGTPITTSYVMSAPAGEADVTPLSTLVHVLLIEATDGGETPEELEQKKQQAVQEVASQLGLDEEDVLGDFIENDVPEAAFAAENIIEAEVLPEDSQQMQEVVEEVKQQPEESSFLKTTEAVNEKIKEVVENSDDIENEAPVFEEPVGSVDSDGEGVADDLDALPDNPNEYLDSDKDGLGNNEDPDDDNDGIADADEIANGTNPFNADTDGDGALDSIDLFPLDSAETSDNDSDGIGDNADTDDDNDGLSDTEEAELGTDHLNADSDDDGVIDSVDRFPLDETETQDTDSDGTGNKADTDDDGDGVLDVEDRFPLDASESVDTDNDGTGNNADTDDDNDGTLDVDDRFPLDSTETIDTDNDGTGNNADTDDDGDMVPDIEDHFPLDGSESVDTDNDGIGNNADTDDDDDGVLDGEDRFPLDNTESIDTDNDGTGNNADTDDDNDGVLDGEDRFPLDSSESADSDNDGVGDNADAHPEDGNKSVADVESDVSATDVAILNTTDRDVIKLDIDVEKVVEVLHSGETVTTITTQYITADDVVYGTTQTVDRLLNEDFTRIETFAYDYDLDGTALYEGMLLEIGTRTESSETYWRYIDEGDASVEGGFGGNGRVYDQGVALTPRVHPTDLSQIDIVHSVSVEFEDVVEGVQAVETLTEYSPNGFDIEDAQTHQAQWAQTLTTVTSDHVQSFVESKQDWDADGSINVELRLASSPDGSYIYEYSTPIWANPQDGEFHEYADYNFVDGKWDDLTAYWNYYRKEVLSNGDVAESGQRMVLDEETNAQLIVDNDSANTLFHEWNALSRIVSDEESNKHVEWHHYPLADYPFTTDTDNVGQAYRVYQKQSNGLWVATSFDEWGTQAVVDLPQQVEDARANGKELEAIDGQVIAGLNRYAAKMPTGSFQYDENGAVQWHVVTQDSLLTDTGIPTLVSLDLGDGGVVPGALVGIIDVDMVLVVPTVEFPWSWYDAYYRRGINTLSMDLTEGAFSWENSLGMFFLDETAAQDYLTQVLNQDSDNDGYKDYEDAFPNNPSEWNDIDGDHVGDNGDAFPDDPSEWADSDSDGLGDNYENATEGLDPNNADSDGDDVNDGEDLYPTDPTKWTITAHEFVEQEGTLYGFFSEWSDISNVDILFKETLNYGGDALTLAELIQYRGDQSFISLPLEAEGDLQLTENGWQVPAGYTIDFSGEQVIAYPEDNSSLYYSVESEVVNLSDMALSDVDFEWDNFMDEARFAQGSEAVRFTFSPAVNQYYLWEGYSPYVRFSDVGYDTDGSSISALDEIIVSQSVGESVDADLITSVSIFADLDIELVNDGAAHYYLFDWNTGTANRIATASYTRHTLYGEEIVEFTVPTEVMAYTEESEGEPNIFFSMYNGELTVGEVEMPSAEPSDDTMYMFNGIAAQSIEDGVVLSDYLFTCYLGDSDDQSSPTMSDYELAITDCGGRTHFTSDMVEDLNFQRIKGNGDSRDYLFNADGTVHVLKGEGGDYTDNWEIVDGYIEVSYSDESESFTSYWALLDSLDGTWSIKFYEVETLDGQTSSYIWEDTVVQRERPAMLSACYIGDAEPVEGQPIPSMSDYETAISLCGGRNDITTNMIEGLNFQRVKGDGNTRDYLFNADGTVHVLKGEGGEYTDDWTIEDGLIKVSYSDESESFTAYWALLESMDQTWSIKFFEEETVAGVSESWIWADTVVQQDRNALQFDPTNLVLMEQDDNNFFFHADGSMSYIGNDDTELYGNSWVKTSADTMMITYEDFSTEQWVLVSQTDDELTISRDGAEEVLTNVTYEGKTLCESGDSPWDDITDQPSDFGTRSEYDSAVANCTVGGAQFIESDFTGNGSESSRWELIDLWEINGTVMEAVEEEVVFHSNGTGYFVNDEGLFSFNWAISSGEVTLDITASGFEGAKDIWNKVDQDGDNTMTKAFWSDPTWNNPAPAEGEAEITSGVMRFVHFENQ
ncbi:hypothetical protein AB4571_15780 [Vibrio breoganii]